MDNNAMKLLGSWNLASHSPHERHLINHSEMWMAILMLYLPPLHFYRNNSSTVITLCANIFCYLFISLPIYLVEILTASFSHGNLVRAYNYNRFARVILCVIILHQFQNLTSGTANAHKIITFSLTFFLQNLNPHVSLWNCHNPWNTELCCLLLVPLNSSIEAYRKMKARCSTPLEEFYKHHGNIIHSGIYQPSSSTYDGGHVQIIVWFLLAVFLIVMVQRSLSEAIKLTTYLITIPCLLLLIVLYLHCFRQPMTSPKITNLVTRRDKFQDEYTFTFFMPNIYYANQMMMAGGYLVVLHCCRKPHQTKRQLASLFNKNLIFLAIVSIAYKSAICVLRHGTVGIIKLNRQRMAGFVGTFDREVFRDVFEDSKDWLYQIVFDYIEILYSFRQQFQFRGPWMALDGAAILHPVLLSLGFIGIRIAIYKATLELLFQSIGYPELLSGPWQLLTRLSLPLSVVSVCLVADTDLLRDALFPKEPFGYAFCSLNVVLFLPSFVYASFVHRSGIMGHSLHWRMMKFALRYKRSLVILGILSGLHLFGAQIYKNVFVKDFKRVLRSTKDKKTPNIEYFFEYDVGVFGSPAQRVFSFSGVTANWVLNDVFYGLFGTFSLIFALLQSDRVVNFIETNRGMLYLFFCKPARCFRHCVEFYFVVMFGKSNR
ncbi:hypothetical protein BOX15_Mlig011660g2 [Macrostomum lignano]|uniref:Uncharacterized protein n=1 Tax=Macrostomum lignano TaxID=282301 RepID=A0A267GCW0_9PLAT|nr:hypothetical protein BOX15_Mlig011660g2 [Macrostomum lignano]